MINRQKEINDLLLILMSMIKEQNEYYNKVDTIRRDQANELLEKLMDKQNDDRYKFLSTLKELKLEVLFMHFLEAKTGSKGNFFKLSKEYRTNVQNVCEDFFEQCVSAGICSVDMQDEWEREYEETMKKFEERHKKNK